MNPKDFVDGGVYQPTPSETIRISNFEKELCAAVIAKAKARSKLDRLNAYKRELESDATALSRELEQLMELETNLFYKLVEARKSIDSYKR
jgi:hypothetical protein